MKKVKVGQLFGSQELRALEKLVLAREWAQVRAFLNEREEDLLSRGILPDYLFYYLQYLEGLQPRS